jgi:hypothetical protein
MTATRPRDLLVVALVVAVLANLAVRLSYESLPGFPLLAGVTLGVLGTAEAVGGTLLQARIQRKPGTRPVEPLVAARAVVLAKASSLGGAVVAGAWAGLLGYVVPRASAVSAAAADTAAGVVGLVCALALVGGALWLERCCRAPGDGDPRHP